MGHERLSVTDTTFLHLDAPATPMNMGAVLIFEGGPLLDDAGRLRMDLVRRAAASVVPGRPRNRQRPMPVPFGLGRPVWVDDPDFDLDDHMDAVTLAEPTSEALFSMVAEWITTPFERTRPLWSYRFVDGLPDGQVAVVARVHHAHRDGGSALASFEAMFSLTPDVPEFPTPEPWTPAPLPSRSALMGGALSHQGRHAAKVARIAGRAVRSPRRAAVRGRRMLAAVGPFVGKTRPVPRLSFNRPAGARRRLATAVLPLDDCKAVRAAFGCTVNDVLVAAVAGGVRRLLVARGECRPAVGVTVMCPVSNRAAGDASAGNQSTALTVTVQVAEPDPVARLRQVHAETSRAKDDDQAADMAFLVELSDFVVPVMLRGAVRKVHGQQGYNLSVSNLAGPPVPLWLLGARLREIYPFAPLIGPTGVSVTALSHSGSLFVGFNACAEALPDLDVLTAGVVAELAELVARAGADGPA